MLASVVLSAALLTVRRRIVTPTVGLVSLGFAVADIREVVHQLNASRPSLLAVAALVALMHLSMAAICAGSILRPTPTLR